MEDIHTEADAHIKTTCVAECSINTAQSERNDRKEASSHSQQLEISFFAEIPERRFLLLGRVEKAPKIFSGTDKRTERIRLSYIQDSIPVSARF